MSLDAAADLAFMLQDAGSTVVYGRVRTYGVLDVADEALFATEVGIVGVKRTLTYATGTLAGLKTGDTLSVAGASYKVMAPPQRQEDGALSVVPLGNA